MLNARQIQKFIIGPLKEENIQQVGIDLNVIQIRRIVAKGTDQEELSGLFIEKTILPDYQVVDLSYHKGKQVWHLPPGAYDVTFAQGCEIPCDTVLLIRQRSSLLRNGGILHSSVFDPGFKTTNIGTVIILQSPLIIEHGARIAQIYGYHLIIPVAEKDLYGSSVKKSQFQNDKQRNDD